MYDTASSTIRLEHSAPKDHTQMKTENVAIATPLPLTGPPLHFGIRPSRRV